MTSNYVQKWRAHREQSIYFARQAMIALIQDHQRDAQQIATISWHVSRAMMSEIPPLDPPKGWREQCKKAVSP